MKVFLSWSGSRSRAVANLMREWLSAVIQASRPWISTQDLDRGAIWFSEIQGQLQESALGIICLTAENKERPWIMFEAGALAKSMVKSRVCTFLIDIQPADVTGPLAQFNHTLPTRESMYLLVQTLNAQAENQRLSPATLDTVFETYWPKFEADFQNVIRENPAGVPTPVRPSDDILAEILTTVRNIWTRVGQLESERTFPLGINSNGSQGPSISVKDCDAVDGKFASWSAKEMADYESFHDAVNLHTRGGTPLDEILYNIDAPTKFKRRLMGERKRGKV